MEFGLSSTVGADRYVYLWYPNAMQVDCPEAYIKLPIVNFRHHKIPDMRPMLYISYYGCEYFQVKDAQCAIAWSSLPSIDDLIRCYTICGWDYNPFTGPFHGLHKAIRELASLYCHSGIDLPLVHEIQTLKFSTADCFSTQKPLLKSALRLRYLFGIYRTGPVMKDLAGNGKIERASTATYLQLRLVAARAIIQLEAEVLANIDKFAFGSGTIGRRNPLAIWLCLWVLLLSYKDHMVYMKALSPEGRGNDAQYTTDFLEAEIRSLYALTCHLYNAITSIFAALYKTTSPLTLDWRTGEVAAMLGHDSDLIKSFSNVKTEIYWFRTSIHFPRECSC
jgi:hypothetical protein